MSLNEEIASRNRELVYGKVKEFIEKHAVVPKQAEIIALCPNISRPTVRKYLEECLKDSNRSHTDDDEEHFSPEFLAALQTEIRNKKARAHEKIHERLKEFEKANEVIAAENEDLKAQIQTNNDVTATLHEKLGYYQGQFEMQGEEITKLSNELQHAEDRIQTAEKSAQEAMARERDTIEKLTEALTREQKALADLKILGESSKHSEILAKIFEWIEQVAEKQKVSTTAKVGGKATQQIRS